MDMNKIFGPIWFILGIVSATTGLIKDDISLISLGILCYIASLIHSMKETIK